MIYHIDLEMLQCLIAMATVILVYWLKISMDKGIYELKTALDNINAKNFPQAPVGRVVNIFPSGKVSVSETSNVAKSGDDREAVLEKAIRDAVE